MNRLKIAIAQINPTVGDLAGNARKIIAAAKEAHAEGADLLLTPELALSGYPPEDLLLRPAFHRHCAAALCDLAQAVPELAVLVGHPECHDGRRYNAASLLLGGQRQMVYYKQRLPNYDVFDEVRYFSPGEGAGVFTLKGVRCGVNICADIWESGPAERAHAQGAELLLVLNASPYHIDKHADRLAVLRARVEATGMAAVYTNLVGGQDELVFDGGSFVLDPRGNEVMRLPAFSETLTYVDVCGRTPQPGAMATVLAEEAAVYQALVLGVRDYVEKNGFPGAIIGLSGGIDSALTLCVAVDALGADRVRAVMMPSPYTARISLEDSRKLVAQLGVRYDELPIAPLMASYSNLLSSQFAGLAADTTEENLQARIRGNLLMALSNKTGALVLTTGNKSEMAVGYCTLYGDMAGGFAVIKDVAKTLVYRLSRWINRNGEIIPERIITRPPSAELKPDQTDQDNLPAYDVLDAIIAGYMESNQSPDELMAAGYAGEDVTRVVRLLRLAEHKRRQAPVGIRITQRGFGRDWRYPVTNRYRDEL